MRVPSRRETWIHKVNMWIKNTDVEQMCSFFVKDLLMESMNRA